MAYLIFIVWFSTEILFKSTMEYFMLWKRQDANDVVAIIILVLSIIQITAFQEYSVREILILVMGSVPIIIGTMASNNYVMLSAWLFILTAKYTDFDKMVKLSYFILIVTMLFVLYLFWTGSISEVIMYRKGIIRHSWGFYHPNWLGVRIFELVIAHCYIKRRKIGLYDLAMVLFGIWFTYKVPNCQTAYVSLGVFFCLLVFYFLFDHFVGGKELFGKIIILSSVFSNIFSVGLSLINVKKIPFLAKLDRMLSWRFSNCYRTINSFGIHVYGSNVDLYSKKMGLRYVKYYLDIAYTSILVRYGIVVYIIFSTLYIYAMIYWYKKNNYMLVIIFGVYAIYGIMENTLYSLTQNIFLLGLAYPLYNKDFIDNMVDKVRRKFKIIFEYGA